MKGFERKRGLFTILTATIIFVNAYNQSSSGRVDQDYDKANAVHVTVPFLSIAPDSRASALGDAGVATSPDIYSQHWNVAKYAFAEADGGIALAYSPWLRNLISGINLAYLTGYTKLKGRQTISGSLRYFNLGSIVMTNDQGEETGINLRPHEFALDVGYSRAFSDKISGGLVFRYIHSNLSNGQIIGGTVESKPGNAFAADIATYYKTPIEAGDKDGSFALGLNISNIGTKIAYTNNQEEGFIPINIRLGTSITIDLDDYNSLSAIVDLNKLLVPTNPELYAVQEILPNGDTVQFGDEYIKYGMDPNVPVLTGMIQSFYDAPGGLSEEINEIMYSVGLEYWYAKQFAVRAGYFYEHQNKGNRKFLTFGIGVRYNVFSLDFSYLAPTSGRNHPLSNTVRFTLGFGFGDEPLVYN